MNSTLCRRPGVFCCVRTTLTEGGIEGEKGMGVPQGLLTTGNAFTALGSIGRAPTMVC